MFGLFRYPEDSLLNPHSPRLRTLRSPNAHLRDLFLPPKPLFRPQRFMPFPSVSIVVPVHNGAAAFEKCLAALSRSLHAPDEVIVVDDGSTDRSGQAARRCGARVLRNSQPQGPAAARNRGAQAATSDLLFFVDADVTVHPDTVGRVADAFCADPKLDALIGSYDDAPADPHFLSQYRNLLHHFTHQRAREEASTFWGACGAIRRDVFARVGGFDERFARPSIEDIELGYRLTEAGHRIRLDKDVQVTHLKRWTAGSMLKTDLLRRGVPWTELILRSGSLPSDLNVDLRSRLSVALVAASGGLLIASLKAPRLLALTPFLIGIFTALNRQFYNFLRHARGEKFMLKAIPWHAAYYACSGGAFILGAARYAFTSKAEAPAAHRISGSTCPSEYPS